MTDIVNSVVSDKLAYQACDGNFVGIKHLETLMA